MKTHKGIYYYATREEAERVKRQLGCKNVWEFQRGYAVQLHNSGACVGTEINTAEQVRKHICTWCEA